MKKLIDQSDIRAFAENGFLVVKRLFLEDRLGDILRHAKDALEQCAEPVEFETDVQYPGAPKSIDATGGRTIRRLLGAYQRNDSFREVGLSPQFKSILEMLFASNTLALSQCHHNCVMTKHPDFSSSTDWHQDNRYWQFEQENLITAWTALGHEHEENGCLRVIPGSHRLDIADSQLDEKLFLRTDIPENRQLIENNQLVELNKGDVLFFHSRLFHAAGRNLTDQVKYSLVFTYHETSNRPIANSKSARLASIAL